jgi:predicted metal-dependent phosphoesterase TrpH
MGKADLHAHTCHDGWGDGNQGVEELFRWVDERTDLDLFGITDHDSTSAARAGWEIHRRGEYRFGFVPVVEVTNQAGHLLCYFPSGEIHDIPSLRPFWWTVAYARERGAICIAAHPVYPPWLRVTLRRGLDSGKELDGIEIVNAGVSAEAQCKLDRVAERFAGRLANVGFSDAHDQAAIAAGYTTFPGNTVEDFVRALRDRQTQAVCERRPKLEGAARSFTIRRSMTRPGWVRNVWRELRGS